MNETVPIHVVQPLYTAVGALVINWAFVEQSLDSWIAIIFQTHDRRHMEKVIPMALKRKFDFLRKCFNRIEALAAFRYEALSLMTKAESLSKTRHFVVHGAISKYSEDSYTFKFIKLDVAKDGSIHQLNELNISGHDLLDAGIQCQRLTASMAALSNRLLQSRMG